MPTRLTRYVLGEIFKIFFVALLSLTVLILLIFIGRQLLREGLGPAAVLQLMPYALPISLQFALPATALFAVCSVYGRMAADGEVATLKAAGISPMRIIQPALLFGLLLSPLAVWLSDMAVSWGKPGVQRVVLLSLEEIVYRTLGSQRSYSSPKGISLHVQDVQGRQLLWPTITFHSRREGEPITATAQEGSLSLNAERQTLSVRLVDCQIHGGRGLQGHLGEFTQDIPLDLWLANGSSSSSRPSELPLRTIGPEAVRTRHQIDVDRQRLAARAGFSLATGRWEDAVSEDGWQLQTSIHRGRARLARLHTEPWRRWAGGFSCFFFILVGAPLAVLVRNADYWTSFGLCFFPILLVYYPLFLLGLDQAKAGSLPPQCVWLGNAVLMLVGLYLTKKVWRY